MALGYWMNGDGSSPSNAVILSNSFDAIAPTPPSVGTITLSPTPVYANSSVSANVSFTDREPHETHTASWNWGDGSSVTTGTVGESNGSGTVAGTHTYTTDGTYTVTVTVTNNAGFAGTASGTAIVQDGLPNIQISGNSPIPVNGTYSATGSFSDDDSTSWIATVDYGDGAGPQPITLNSNKTFVLSHVYTAEGDYAVTVYITDNQGGVGTGTDDVNVVRQLSALNPATLYISKSTLPLLPKYDLKADVYTETPHRGGSVDTFITSGELDGINPTGTAAETVSFNSFSPVVFPSGSALKINIYACNASGLLGTGTTTLHYNAAAVDSKFGATIGGTDTIYHLLSSGVLGTSDGSSAQTLTAQSKCSTGFTSFGTWIVTP